MGGTAFFLINLAFDFSMEVITTIFYYLLSFIMSVGDVILFSVMFIYHLLLIISTSLMKNVFLTRNPKLNRSRKRKNKKVTLFPFPVFPKIKYFFLGIVFSFFFLFLPLLFFITIQTLPNPQVLNQAPFAQTTKIFDRNHQLLYQLYANENRTNVPLTDVPLALQQATIAIEDKNFYKNPGFDISAIIRAGISDLSGHGFQGGSTITQQLIKSSLLTSEVSLKRKAEEVMLAFWAEKIYSKKKILELYFNQVPYGGTAWGVEAASETYFGKEVKNLDLAESAFLAGMPQAPTLYSPYGDNPLLWKSRQKEVLVRMRELGYISQKQVSDTLSENLVFQTPKTPLLAPHFVMYIKNLLIQKYGLAAVEKGGLNVTTSLDLSTQEKAQNIVSTEISHDDYLHVTNGAAIITNPKNGDILAMVGSADYNNPDWGNVNLATSFRQPGSSIKIVTYALALSKGFTPATILDDSPVAYSLTNNTIYAPVNYDGRFHGRVSLRIALANSFNIPAVKTLNTFGISNFVDLGRQMGIQSLRDPSEYGLSLTLGSADVTMLDMSTAFGTLANLGNRVDLNPILEVTDYTGTVLEKKKDISTKSVLSSGVAFILSDILADNNARSMEFGPSSPLLIPGHTVSVKTGTSDNKRDNWTIGYNQISNRNRPQYEVTVWVGNNDNTPMSQDLASGITGAAPIWHGIMAELLKNIPDEKFSLPSDITTKPCIGRVEYFIRGTENSIACSFLPSTSPTKGATALLASPKDPGTPSQSPLPQTNIPSSQIALPQPLKRHQHTRH